MNKAIVKFLESLSPLNWVMIAACIAIVFVMVFANCGTAHAAYNWKAKDQRFSATAGEAITRGDVLAIKDADGYAYKADMDDSTLNRVVGVAGASAASGASVEIVTQGILDGFSSLGEGQPVLASSVAGGYTTVRLPGENQQVGAAISTTQALIDIGQAYGNEIAVLTTSTALANAYNHKTIVNTGATGIVTLTLPDAVAGYELAVSNATTYSIVVNPQDDDLIMNLTDAAGDEIWFDAAGEGVVLKAVDGTNWMPVATVGTITDGN